MKSNTIYYLDSKAINLNLFETDIEFSIFIKGTPVAQPRNQPAVLLPKIARFHAIFQDPNNTAHTIWHWFKKHSRGMMRAVEKKHPVNAWKAIIEIETRRLNIPDDWKTGPLQIDLFFVLPRPKNEYRKTLPNPRYFAAKKPDKDNLEKAVLDAIGSIYANDSHVVTGTITKVVASDTDQPGVAIRIKRPDASQLCPQWAKIPTLEPAPF